MEVEATAKAMAARAAKAKKEPKEKATRTGKVVTDRELVTAGTRGRMAVPLGKGSGKNGKPSKPEFDYPDQPADDKDPDNVFV